MAEANEVADQPEEQPYDANDPAQVNQRKRDAGRRKHAGRKVMASILATAPGRAWLFDLLSAGHMYQTSFVSGATDATAFREGERNICLKLTAQAVAVSPENFLLMLKEKGAG